MSLQYEYYEFNNLIIMKSELSFEQILRYYKKELSTKEALEVKQIIEKNKSYQKILDGIIKIDKEEKEDPEIVINSAKQRFLNKFFPLVLLLFISLPNLKFKNITPSCEYRISINAMHFYT